MTSPGQVTTFNPKYWLSFIVQCCLHFYEAIVFSSEKLIFMRFKVLTQALTP